MKTKRLGAPRKQSGHHSCNAFASVLILACALSARTTANGEVSRAIPSTAAAGNPVLPLEDRDLWIIEDAPLNHLARASEALSTSDAEAATIELHTAALFLRAQAARTEGTAKSDLLRAAAELESAAFSLKYSSGRAPDEATNAVARTYLCLAQRQWAEAVRAQAREDADAMQRHIGAAADLLERHLQSAGDTIDQTTRKLLADARNASHSLEITSREAVIGFGEMLKSLGCRIEQCARSGNPTEHQ